MALVPRQRKNKIVFYVANKQGKVLIWEKVGTDRREAMRRDAAMRKEIKAGIYRGLPTGAKTVGAQMEIYLAARQTRTVDDDRRNYRDHVAKRCAWFTRLKLEDVRVAHVIRLAEELKAPYVNKKGETKSLAANSHNHIFRSLLGPFFRNCRIHDLMIRNVMELPKGLLSRQAKRRVPYDATTVIAMTTDERLPLHWRVAFTLLFYTGIRTGEACGLKFGDYDADPVPFGSLTIEKQYVNAPLKTAVTVGDEHTRWVPVLPFLRDTLAEWWAHGFERTHCRKPTKADYVIARSDGAVLRCVSGHTIYRWFLAALEIVGVENKTVHATRNTFISLARRAGARGEVLEKVTHNAKGSIIDCYTNFDWAPLCDAAGYFNPYTAGPKMRAVG